MPRSGLLEDDVHNLLASSGVLLSQHTASNIDGLVICGSIRKGTEYELQFAPSTSVGLAPSSALIASCSINCIGGGGTPILPPQDLHPYHHVLLARMVQSHAIGKDVCLVGGRGEGKSHVGRVFARVLGYDQVETLFLFEDMTARDLLQRRTTTQTGATVWQETPLTTAVRTGRLCVLDGQFFVSYSQMCCDD